MTPCWIICSPRCGSTYLCDLLNNTNLFEPKFVEYFNAQFTNPKLLPFCKIQPNQWKKNKLNVRIIRDKFPNIKFIQITRKNFIDRATSYCLANLSNIWSIGDNVTNDPLNCFQKSKRTYINKEIKIDEDVLNHLTKSLILEIEKEKKIIEEIEPIIKVDYEEIISDPIEVLSKILLCLGYSGTIKTQSILEKMPEKPEKEKIKKMILKHFVKVI
ncbi:MAG: hypothetical protein FJ356_05250 [Thaumarchaeota archaeon]|nr:hypothetical protein [Nitrososphaerota archaeon]